MREKVIFHREGKLCNIKKEDDKVYTVKISVEIKEKEGESWEMKKGIYRTLSVTGEINYMRENISIGQVWEEIVEAVREERVYNCDIALLSELLCYWAKYHLNDLIPGTKRQMMILEVFGYPCEYPEQEKVLERVGLLIDNGYRSGTKWLVEPIPEEVIERIIEIANKIIK